MSDNKQKKLRLYVTLENRCETSPKTKMVIVALPLTYAELTSEIGKKFNIDVKTIKGLEGYNKQEQTHFDIDPNDKIDDNIDPGTIIYVSRFLKPPNTLNINTKSAATTETSNIETKEDLKENYYNEESKENWNEESLNKLLPSKRIRNPYIIVNGISDYSKSQNKKWPNLKGVIVDIKNMINLWNGIYGYKNMSISLPTSNHNDDKNENEKKNDSVSYDPTAMANKENYNDFLVGIRTKIDSNKYYDGLIYYYSGHGIKNNIILENGQQFRIKQIYQTFNGKQCISLRDKPKILIFDSCRGDFISGTYDVIAHTHAVTKGPNNDQQKDKWIDSKYHSNSGLATIFGNFEDYSINDSEQYGGCLTRAIYKVFNNPRLIVNHSLRDLIVAIRRQTKINSGPGNVENKSSCALVDFHETLEYKVYFDKYKSVKDINNDNNNKADKDDSDETKEEEAVMTCKQKHPECKQENAVASKSSSNDIRWRFDFHYDSKLKGPQAHGIDKDGRRFQCNHDGSGLCYCFSTIGKYGMACNTGIYKIKLKIDKVHNYRFWNMVGLTSDNLSDGSIDLNNDCTYRWAMDSDSWIGWSSYDVKLDELFPNGLCCGNGDSGRASNIFRRNGFKYASRNDRYTQRLPAFKSGDKVVMIYNSDLRELSFELFKKNQKVSLLDSYIYNLPPDLTFYWFVGHGDHQMSVTILD